MNDSADESGPRLPSHSDLRWMHQRLTLTQKSENPQDTADETIPQNNSLLLQMYNMFPAMVSVVHIYFNVTYPAAMRVEIKIWSCNKKAPL